MRSESSYEPKTMLENNHDRILNTFKEAIISNNSLNPIEAIMETFDTILYHAMIHDIPIPFDRIIERIQTVKFTLGNRYVLKEAYQYDVLKNEISLKQSEMGEKDTYYFTMMLYDLALHPEAKDPSYFEALYKGELVDLTLSTLGEEDIPSTSFDEVMLYRSLKAILGEEVIADGLLTQDCALIYQTMQDLGFKKEDIQTICKTSNYNQYGRYPTGNSTLLDVQMRIIDVFMENAPKEPSTKQKIHFLKKAINMSSKQLKDTNLKYGLKNLNEIKRVLGEKALTETSNFSILSDYFEQKSISCGLNELNYGTTK